MCVFVLMQEEDTLIFSLFFFLLLFKLLVIKLTSKVKIRQKKTLQISSSIAEKRHKIWARQSTFAGGPTVVRGRQGTQSRPRPNSNYGFGSRIDRFTAIQSTPSSPMVENSPLKWFVRDIDIGDNAGSQRPEMFGHRPIRTRSRHECHFSTGSSVPMGNLVSSLLLIFFFCMVEFLYFFVLGAPRKYPWGLPFAPTSSSSLVF